ncbi:hypothetical protein UYSO10_2722 [Kosakonia radicincitans]|nr:hypothetical protein UYSO10_2722 [Kosakonia radicincitans]
MARTWFHLFFKMKASSFAEIIFSPICSNASKFWHFTFIF